jgi:hypothetical protein
VWRGDKVVIKPINEDERKLIANIGLMYFTMIVDEGHSKESANRQVREITDDCYFIDGEGNLQRGPSWYRAYREEFTGRGAEVVT